MYAEIKSDRVAGKNTEIHSERQAGKNAEIHSERQAGRKTDRQAGRGSQIVRQEGRIIYGEKIEKLKG